MIAKIIEYISNRNTNLYNRNKIYPEYKCKLIYKVSFVLCSGTLKYSDLQELER